jgi:hypothetical protein
MTTASHTMIARVAGHQHERRGLAMFAAGALAVVLALAALSWPPRILADTSHEAR